MMPGEDRANKPRRTRATLLGVLLIVAAFLLGLMTLGLGFGLMPAGLSEEFLQADAPGVYDLDAGPGMYDIVRNSTAHPTDAGPLTIHAIDPDLATITPHAAGSYVEYGPVRFDLLASVEVHRRGPVQVALEGDQAHFPVVVRRDQISWMRYVGVVTAAVAVVPIGLFIAGIVVLIREKQRQTNELIEFVSGV